MGIILSEWKRPNGLHIKKITSIFENIYIDKKLIQFIDWIADYTLAPKGLVLKLILINNKIVDHDYSGNSQNIIQSNKIKLNEEQSQSYKIIKKSLISKFHPIILQGVTGSGKTEVYFEAICRVLEKKKTIFSSFTRYINGHSVV